MHTIKNIVHHSNSIGENKMSETLEEKMEKASKTLAMMLDYLGLEAGIKSKEKNGRIYLTTVSDDAGRIIGRKGRTLEDLQLLINKMINKGDEAGPKIYIDVDGYSRKPQRRRREETASQEEGKEENAAGNGEQRRNERGRKFDRSKEGGRGRRFNRDRRERRDRGNESESYEDRENIVRQQAIDASKEVKKWGEPVTLPPMNSRDRRIVHLALQDDPEISTESRETNDPKLKSVVISLKKTE